MSATQAADLCRVCANPPDGTSMCALFDEADNPRALAFILARVSDLPIMTVDAGMPRSCCSECRRKLEEVEELRKLCQEADLKLRKMVQDEPEELAVEELCLQEMDSKEDIVKQESSFLSEEEECDFEPFENSDSDYVEEKPKKRKYVRRITENSNSSKKTKQHKKEKRTYQCATCGHFSSTAGSLKEHEITHRTHYRPHHCDKCPKTFARHTSFRRHLETHEPKTHSFRCEECDKSFSSDRARKEHIQAVHKKERPFKCKLCPKSYPRGSTLWAHVQDFHHNRKSFKCDTCSRGFSSNYILTRHKLTHEGKKLYQCPHCDKKYESNNYLKQHFAERHPETMPNVARCAYCGMGYYADGHYRKHVSHKHPERLDELLELLKRKKQEEVGGSGVV
uniref:Zinc finger and SCAN domain-containing protein 31 n=1 Tax=Culex pipiens TaxID=7175 RepID=A0A8D8P9K0_CULPI